MVMVGPNLIFWKEFVNGFFIAPIDNLINKVQVRNSTSEAKPSTRINEPSFLTHYVYVTPHEKCQTPFSSCHGRSLDYQSPPAFVVFPVVNPLNL